MEPNFKKPGQNCNPPLNSSKPHPESLSNSHQENLGLFDLADNSSHSSGSTDPDNYNSDIDSLLEEEEDVSPIRNYPHWSQPWAGMNVQKPVPHASILGAAEEHDYSGPDWTDMPSPADLQVRPSAPALLTDRKDRYFVGAGLRNLGNTCFLNSVLQCFTHTVPFLQGIISFNHRMPCNDFSEGFCVLCALRQVIELSLLCTGAVVSPEKLVENLNHFSSGFGRFEQEDAHEFLQCFLDKLESCCNDLMLKDTMSLGNNFVKEVFGGRLLSTLRCCNCDHCSDTYEPSIDLSLEIDDADTLYTALDSFTKIEKIEDPETKFTCEKCNEQVTVQKQLMWDQAPSVATFHLKRFKNEGSVVDKIGKFIAFPLKLNLQPYTVGGQVNNAELKYDLYAVVVHAGQSPTSGHYYCCVRLADDAWFKFDDSMVMQVSEEYVLSHEAYILLYAKQGTPWFSSFIETQKKYIDLATLNNSPTSVLDNMDASTSSSCMPPNCCGDVNEISDETTEGFLETSSGPSKTDHHADKENNDPVTVPCVPSCEAADTPSECILRERDSNEGFVEVEVVADATPRTPSRSPSPEIYGEDRPESTFSILRGHLRSAEHASCKRQLNKDLESYEMKQACTLIKKSIPGSRGQQLMQAMRGSRSEGSLSKKRSRSRNLSPTSKNKKANTCSRGRIPLVAASLR